MTHALPFFVVFIASACVMVTELVASRMIAQYVGSNLYTWTSIIAVVLAGLSLGNLAGGVVADRVARNRAVNVVAGVLVASAALVLVVIALVGPVFERTGTTGWNLPTRVLVSVLAVYFVPSVMLGSVSPLAATWAIQIQPHLGATVGTLYAVGSLGAIFGTLLTGFVLVSTLGSIATLVLVAIVLSATGVLVHRGLATVLAAVFVVTVGVVVAWASGGVVLSSVAQSSGIVVFAEETDYQTVAVAWDPERNVRTVVLDNLVHGFVLPDEPRLLLYPYIAMYASAYSVQRSATDAPLASLHLGGGAYTLPRFILDVFPEDEVVVSEIDPAVTEASHVAARLDRPPPFELHHADAREVVRSLGRSNRTVDVVFADAFSDYAIPFHLATVEFYQEVDTILPDDGLLLQNVIDDLSRPAMLASIVRTVRAVHPHVVVFSPAPLDALHGRDTFVVASSRAPIDEAQMLIVAREAGLDAATVPFEHLEPEATHRWRAYELSDDFAPVERLLLHLYATAPGSRTP